MADRKFGGETYKSYGNYTNKRAAEQAVQGIRNKGWFARLTSTSQGYTVWYRQWKGSVS